MMLKMRRLAVFIFVFGTAAIAGFGGFLIGMNYQISGVVHAICDSRPNGSDVEEFSIKPIPDGNPIPEDEQHDNKAPNNDDNLGSQL